MAHLHAACIHEFPSLPCVVDLTRLRDPRRSFSDVVACMQVEALLNGHIDIAWNGPLAHVRVQRRTGGKYISLGMRDCDRGFQSQVRLMEKRKRC
jgi:hypothetical protein